MMTETVVNVQDAPNSNSAKQPPQGGNNNTAVNWIKINVEYFKTLPGIIKFAQLVFGIICMILPTTYLEDSTHFFLLVTVLSFIGTLLWAFVYFLGVREAMGNYPINWILTEFISAASCAVAFCIASLVQIGVWSGSIFFMARGRNIAAGAIGLFQTILYGFGAYLLWIEHKRN